MASGERQAHGVNQGVRFNMRELITAFIPSIAGETEKSRYTHDRSRRLSLKLEIDCLTSCRPRTTKAEKAFSCTRFPDLMLPDTHDIPQMIRSLRSIGFGYRAVGVGLV